jgi:hypothetical protein
MPPPPSTPLNSRRQRHLTKKPKVYARCNRSLFLSLSLSLSQFVSSLLSLSLSPVSALAADDHVSRLVSLWGRWGLSEWLPKICYVKLCKIFKTFGKRSTNLRSRHFLVCSGVPESPLSPLEETDSTQISSILL